MSTIIVGMTPTQFITAMNTNQTDAVVNSKSFQWVDTMAGHEIKTALSMNGLANILLGSTANIFISSCNATIDKSTSTIAGVADVREFGAVGDGTTDDAIAINTAVQAGNIIIQNGVFKISAPIRIPSNRTIYIKNAKIVRADAVYDNMFRNYDIDNGNTDIKIIGLGNAELDLNRAGNDWDTGSPPGFGPSMYYRVVCIFMCQVTRFEFANLYCDDYSRWFFRLQNSSYINIHDLIVDREVTALYQDFCNTAHCNNLEAYNLTVTCSDDFLNITFGDQSNAGDPSYKGFAGWNVGDCFNYHLHDVNLVNSHWGGLIVPIGSGDNSCYNILAERVRMRSGGSIFYNCYGKTLYSNDTVKDKFHDIVIKDVQIDAMPADNSLGLYIFQFGQDMKNFSAINITNNSGRTLYRIGGFAIGTTYHAGLADVTDDVKINGVQVS